MGNHVLVDTREQPVHTTYVRGARDPFLIPMTFANAHGVWKSFSITTQTTTIITSPDNGGCLLATGLTLAAKKVNAGNIQIRFSDGTNNEAFYDALTTNGEINLDFNWENQNVVGWKDARMEIITSGANPTLTGMLRYIKVTDCDEYDEWQSKQ